MVGDETANPRDTVDETSEEHLPIEPEADASDAAVSGEAEQAEPATPVTELSLDELQAQLAQAQQKLDEQRDSVLRAQAEVQNVRRRAERDVEHAHKFALEKFAGDLLPVVDSLERALQSVGSDDEAAKATREGVELTLKMLLDAMARYGVQQLNPVGEAFDPQQHEAMSMQPSADVPANAVVAVLQKGYSLNGRLVRPAMVIVSAGA